MPPLAPTASDDHVEHDASPASTKKPKRRQRNTSKPPTKKTEEPPPPPNPAAKKYERNKANIPIKSIVDKKLKGNLRKVTKKYDDATQKAAQTERLLLEDAGYLEAEGMEKTYKLGQKELAEHLDLNNQKKGRKGHIATFDWQTKSLKCEFHVREMVRGCQVRLLKWLHNETMFAVAQKQYVYIYDQTGMEIHCLQKHVEVNCLEFLPYHFLLASVGKPGRLMYQDTSTGQIVAEHKTRLGECKAMRQNPTNAILHLGHNNGTVTLWSPSMTEPIVKMLCHRGPVQSLAIDRSGTYMVTAGLDGQMKVWDVRTYKAVEQYFTPTPASTIDISQMGVLAVGYGPNVTFWKDALKTKAKSPYMHHLQPGCRVGKIRFCPYEDVLGFAHSKGIVSLVVPGSGEPNYDALEANPFQTKKQRKTAEVHSLLEKIQPEMITLDPSVIGTVDRAAQEIVMAEKKTEFEANNPATKFVPRKRARGKSSAMRRYVRKQANILDPIRAAYIEKMDKEKAERALERKRAKGEVVDEQKPYSALDRFAKKRKVE
ncbi:NUC141 domain-containing protein [Chytridium lagenaria]|nr:NUC141 domain-containing protein [Chytridium lagenaria]